MPSRNGGRMVELDSSRFYNEDCIEGARRHLPDASIDLIITDPPYGIEGDQLHQHYNRKEEFVVDGYVEVPAGQYAEFSRRWIAEAARVLRPGGSIYIISGYTHLFDILAGLRATDLQEVNHIIWKYNFGVFTRTKYVSSHYHILFYEKPGGRRTFNVESRFGLLEKDDAGGSLNYEDREDVWDIKREYKPGQVKNKNELPTALLLKIIQYSSNESDTVCDFFMGGFSTAKMAVALGRRFAGFELSDAIFSRKVEEMRTVVPGSLLPSLRAPDVRRLENQGKDWTEQEVRAVLKRYRELNQKNTKKDTIAVLTEEFGRGRFAIEKMLKRQFEPEAKGKATPQSRRLSDFGR